MTGIIEDFLLLKALHGRSVSFGNGKGDNIEGVGNISKSPYHAIENVYFVNELEYSLLSVP